MTVARSYSEAMRTGARFYFTGKPCKRGHVAKRSLIRQMCVECCRMAYDARKDVNNTKRRERRVAQKEREAAELEEKKRAQDEWFVQQDAELAAWKRDHGL